jgi:hypothetical protein
MPIRNVKLYSAAFAGTEAEWVPVKVNVLF